MIGEDEKYITLEKAMELMKKEGITLNENEVRCIIRFLTVLAEIVVAQYLHSDVNKP